MDEARAAELLAIERQQIEDRLRQLRAEFDPGASNGLADDFDFGDQAVDLQERERDLGRIEELGEELAAVARAEQRLADGTYGLSVESGEQIPDIRLERLPTAERTVEEQRRMERLGL
jgi:DnaK suppressor protein